MRSNCSASGVSGSSSLRLAVLALWVTGCGSSAEPPPGADVQAPRQTEDTTGLLGEDASPRAWVVAEDVDAGEKLLVYGPEGELFILSSSPPGKGQVRVERRLPDGVTSDWVRHDSVQITPYVEDGSLRFTVAEVDGQGNVFLAGFAKGATDLLGNAAGDGQFVAKLDRYGQRLWGRFTRAAPGTSFDIVGFATTPEGDLIAASLFNPDSLDSDTSPDVEILLTRYNGATGEPLWDLRTGSADDRTRVSGLDVDVDGNIYFTAGTYQLDIGTTRIDDVTCGCLKGFLVSLDGQGRYRWSHVYNSDPEEIYVAPSPSLVVLGDQAIISGGGAGLIAYDRVTGAENWRTFQGGGWLERNDANEIVAISRGTSSPLGPTPRNTRFHVSRFSSEGTLRGVYHHQSSGIFSPYRIAAHPAGNAFAMSGTYQIPQASFGNGLYGDPWQIGRFSMQVVAENWALPPGSP